MVKIDFDVIIVGAGAAGLMCAGHACRRGRRVLLLDQAQKVGEKIRISGGGRANFTNLNMTPANYISHNPRFCISALKRYDQYDFLRLIDKYAIAYHERDHGQLFCDGSAQQIIDMLLNEAKGVHIETMIQVKAVRKQGDVFHIDTDKGVFTSAALVIATGGPSIPKIGASGFAYGVAKQFGLNVIEPYPGLVPLTFDLNFGDLAGVSVNATVKIGKTAFTEALLFTHRGLSGPVILQISSYWRPGDALIINLLPDLDVFAHLVEAKARQPKKEIRTILAHILPKSLACKIVVWTGVDGRLGETADKALRRVADYINAWRIVPKGTEGLRTAEVTVGGVDTRELSSKTMESKSVPRLYFIGEAVDVTGHLGGFNFQWAWASGHACGATV